MVLFSFNAEIWYVDTDGCLFFDIFWNRDIKYCTPELIFATWMFINNINYWYCTEYFFKEINYYLAQTKWHQNTYVSAGKSAWLKEKKTNYIYAVCLLTTSCTVFCWFCSAKDIDIGTLLWDTLWNFCYKNFIISVSRQI